MDLEGKRAIITGVSKGIGKAIVAQLLERGAVVAGWGLHEPDYSHPKFFFQKVNVREQEEVKAAFQSTISIFENSLDILINNSGLGYFGYFEEMPAEQFHEIMDVNVNAIYYTCHEAIPVMKQAGAGHIINISSIAGLEGMAQAVAYCGAKHAVRGITDSLFRELRDFGIKVTGVYPGSTKTNFFDNAQGIKAHDNMLNPLEVASQIINVLETSDNFLVNELVFRPLQPKPKK